MVTSSGTTPCSGRRPRGSARQVQRFPIARPRRMPPITTINQLQRGLKGEWRYGSSNVGWLGGLDVSAPITTIISTLPGRFLFRTGASCTPCQSQQGRQRDSGRFGGRKREGRLRRSEIRADQALTLTFNGRYDNSAWIIPQSVTTSRDGIYPSASNSKSFAANSSAQGQIMILTRVGRLRQLSTGFRLPSYEQLFRGRFPPSGRETTAGQSRT